MLDGLDSPSSAGACRVFGVVGQPRLPGRRASLARAPGAVPTVARIPAAGGGPGAGLQPRAPRCATNHSTVRCTASGCGVLTKGPNAARNFESSSTKGRSHW